jgi:S-adenosylmethionine-diacylgycerolhomoserine-N-methlytransferase
MWFSKIQSGGDQQSRLESFYAKQAHLYDAYRHRMLHGRWPMARAMPARQGDVWIDLGGGTGSNLEFFGSGINEFGRVIVLDLCPSLAAVAEKRIKERGWKNASVLVADATDETAEGLPAAGSVDLVSFSYSLTMIPDWEKALKNAFRLLKPGGHICVCDFTVLDVQSSVCGWFWKTVFSYDHVHLNPDHIVVLRVSKQRHGSV